MMIQSSGISIPTFSFSAPPFSALTVSNFNSCDVSEQLRRNPDKLTCTVNIRHTGQSVCDGVEGVQVSLRGQLRKSKEIPQLFYFSKEDINAVFLRITFFSTSDTDHTSVSMTSALSYETL